MEHALRPRHISALAYIASECVVHTPENWERCMHIGNDLYCGFAVVGVFMRPSPSQRTYVQELKVGSWDESVSWRDNETAIEKLKCDLQQMGSDGVTSNNPNWENKGGGPQTDIMDTSPLTLGRIREEQVPIITSLTLAESLKNLDDWDDLKRTGKANEDFNKMTRDQQSVIKNLFHATRPNAKRKNPGAQSPRIVHVGNKVSEARTAKEIWKAREQVHQTLRMQTSQSLINHVTRFTAQKTVEPWDTTLKRHGRHSPRVLVTEADIQARTYFQKMKLPSFKKNDFAKKQFRKEMAVFDAIADPLKKIKDAIRKKALEREKKGRQQTLKMIRKAITEGRSVFGKAIYNVVDLCDAIDRDGDGSLDRKEIRDALTRLGCGLPERSMTAFLNEIDADGSGDVDYEELAQALALPFDKDDLDRRNSQKYGREKAPRVFRPQKNHWIPPPSGWALISEGNKIVI